MECMRAWSAHAHRVHVRMECARTWGARAHGCMAASGQSTCTAGCLHAMGGCNHFFGEGGGEGAPAVKRTRHARPQPLARHAAGARR
eukprot:361056-Chlamydomonas_euryale.AAC.1